MAVVADVHDRSGTPLGGVALADDVEGALWSGADALIITGRSVEQTLAMLAEVRPLAGTTPLIVGGGTNPGNVDRVLPHADGAIVGVCLKEGGVESAPVDPSASPPTSGPSTRWRAEAPTDERGTCICNKPHQRTRRPPCPAALTTPRGSCTTRSTAVPRCAGSAAPR